MYDPSSDVVADDAEKKASEDKLEQWPVYPAPPGSHWERERRDGLAGWDWVYHPVHNRPGDELLYDEYGFPIEYSDSRKRHPPGSVTGEIFQQLGYNWLGPGTDIEYNLKHNVEPVDYLDSVAKEHDLAYRDILRDFHNGKITYDEAAAEVSRADQNFISLAGQRNIRDQWAVLGMSLKAYGDQFLGPTWAGLRKEDYGIYERVEDPVEFVDPVYSAPDDKKKSHDWEPGWTYSPSTGTWSYEKPPSDRTPWVPSGWYGGYWDYRRDDYLPPPSGGRPWPSSQGGFVEFDKDRNYYPDRLQAVKRKRHHRSRRNVRSAPYHRSYASQ